MHGLGWMWNELPTRLTVIGLVFYPAVSMGLLRWISRHYVRSPATSWQLTDWAGATENERIAREELNYLEPEIRGDPRIIR